MNQFENTRHREHLAKEGRGEAIPIQDIARPDAVGRASPPRSNPTQVPAFAEAATRRQARAKGILLDKDVIILRKASY